MVSCQMTWHFQVHPSVYHKNYYLEPSLHGPGISGCNREVAALYSYCYTEVILREKTEKKKKKWKYWWSQIKSGGSITIKIEILPEFLFDDCI